eukprot:TRINITY_DN17226_c0_g1_i1.p1 TRINITY_DN17226_c0_g1~~TRINITY_DN17226_c0_g1_i1.p1  ORF type:complete len:1125 (-),score=222.15 TRINITY_DN17226_c0_g1_i1:106-3480(-)
MGGRASRGVDKGFTGVVVPYNDEEQGNARDSSRERQSGKDRQSAKDRQLPVKMGRPDALDRQLSFRSALGGSRDDNGQDLSAQLELDQKSSDWFLAKNQKTLDVAIAFVPWIIMQAFHEGTLDRSNSVVAHRGIGAVVFSDASGFTALTERLAVKSNGAELLSMCLTSFFTPLIDIINSYRGDVIKFSGDALTIYFPTVDDTAAPNYNPAVPPHGTYGLGDLGPMATAVLRASACCIEIHKRLHEFETGVDGVKLCLHIGVGCGGVTILQVGGVVPPETKTPRYEYVIAGEAIEQISIAEPLAKNGESCLSPQAWEYAQDWAIEGRALGPQEPDCNFHILDKIDGQQYTFPCVRHAAMLRDHRPDYAFQLSELSLIRRYIPTNVYKQIENDTLTYVNEMRTISTIFIAGSGVDVSTEEGSKVAHELMSDVQRVCYAYEGTLNKYLVDDKGMLFLLVYGLPPMVHTDDPARAVHACHDIIKVFKRMDLVCRCGVTTGRNYCGVVGSAKRMEYTVLGDTVNLSARLMANAKANSMLIDKETAVQCTGDNCMLDEEGLQEPVVATMPKSPSAARRSMTGGGRKGTVGLRRIPSKHQTRGQERLRRGWVEFKCRALNPIKVKGKTAMIPIYFPEVAGLHRSVGIHADSSVAYPWPCQTQQLGGKSPLLDVDGWKPKAELQNWMDRFEKRGGFLLVTGETGSGKSELVEHMVQGALERSGALPVFSTQSYRPGPKFRPVQELLRSIVLAFRYLDPSLPAEDLPALQTLVSASHGDFVKRLHHDLSWPVETWYRVDLEEHMACKQGLDLAERLLRRLVEQRPVTCVISMRAGTNIFDSSNSAYTNVIFPLTEQLATMAEKLHNGGFKHPLLVILNMNSTDKMPTALKRFITPDNSFNLELLDRRLTLEYISSYSEVPRTGVPDALLEFIYLVTQGNALFVGETVDALFRDGHVRRVNGPDGQKRLLSDEDLGSIDISNWTNTAMVGGTTCMLESLEPLQTAIVKISTVFEGVFTLSDLAASMCSPWAGACYIDALRLFYALTVLISRGIIDRMDSTEAGGWIVNKDIECYRLNNMLIRKVGSALVLESQRKTVLRQAIVARVLARFLPGRMDALQRKKAIIHVPWYYKMQ